MDIEIIVIGNEVLSGHTVNSNAAFLSESLEKEGYFVKRHIVVADDVDDRKKDTAQASFFRYEVSRAKFLKKA